MFESLLKTIGKNISNQRRGEKMTQKDMAERVGLSYRHLQSIEAGEVNMTLSTLFRLAVFFNLKVYDLIREEMRDES